MDFGFFRNANTKPAPATTGSSNLPRPPSILEQRFGGGASVQTGFTNAQATAPNTSSTPAIHSTGSTLSNASSRLAAALPPSTTRKPNAKDTVPVPEPELSATEQLTTISDKIDRLRRSIQSNQTQANNCQTKLAKEREDPRLVYHNKLRIEDLERRIKVNQSTIQEAQKSLLAAQKKKKACEPRVKEELKNEKQKEAGANRRRGPRSSRPG